MATLASSWRGAGPLPAAVVVARRRLAGACPPRGGVRAAAAASGSNHQGEPNACIKVLANNNEFSLTLLRGTQLVDEAARRHRASPTAAAALGRALMGGVLLTAFRGEGEGVAVRFRGTGPLGQVVVVADYEGLVKGYVNNPQADPPLRQDGKLNVGAAVGAGVLSVVRSNTKREEIGATNETYEGMVPITTGEVAEDIAHYLAESEQVNSAIGLGVLMDRENLVTAAGGYFLQVLPFASEETLSGLERVLADAPTVTQMFDEGLSGDEMIQRLMGDFEYSKVGELEARYGPCEVEGEGGLKERMARALALLGEQEAAELIEKEGKVEMTCEFCNEVLSFGRAEVDAAFAKINAEQPKSR